MKSTMIEEVANGYFTISIYRSINNLGHYFTDVLSHLVKRPQRLLLKKHLTNDLST